MSATEGTTWTKETRLRDGPVDVECLTKKGGVTSYTLLNRTILDEVGNPVKTDFTEEPHTVIVLPIVITTAKDKPQTTSVLVVKVDPPGSVYLSETDDLVKSKTVFGLPAALVEHNELSHNGTVGCALRAVRRDTGLTVESHGIELRCFKVFDDLSLRDAGLTNASNRIVALIYDAEEPFQLSSLWDNRDQSKVDKQVNKLVIPLENLFQDFRSAQGDKDKCMDTITFLTAKIYESFASGLRSANPSATNEDCMRHLSLMFLAIPMPENGRLLLTRLPACKFVEAFSNKARTGR